MALFQAVIKKKGHKEWAKTLLMTTKKVKRFYENADGDVIFTYDTRDDSGVRAVDFTTDYTLAQFLALVREPDNAEKFIALPITHIKYNSYFKPQAETYVVNEESLVYGYDNEVNNAELILDEGGFKTITIRCDNSIAEIDAGFSTSASLAPLR
jgi:hypothetical protein